jgi:hypothetical protein
MDLYGRLEELQGMTRLLIDDVGRFTSVESSSLYSTTVPNRASADADSISTKKKLDRQSGVACGP